MSTTFSKSKLIKISLVIGVWFSSFCTFALIFYSTTRSAYLLGETYLSILGAIISIIILRLFLIGLADKKCDYRYFGIAIPIQKNQFIPILVAFFWTYLSKLMQKL